jgi:hypothetical protein
LARPADVPAIKKFMRLSIAENMKAFLSPDELIAAQETMGVDNSLIDDETYYHIETKKNNATVPQASSSGCSKTCSAFCVVAIGELGALSCIQRNSRRRRWRLAKRPRKHIEIQPHI